MPSRAWRALILGFQIVIVAGQQVRDIGIVEPVMASADRPAAERDCAHGSERIRIATVLVPRMRVARQRPAGSIALPGAARRAIDRSVLVGKARAEEEVCSALVPI